MEKPQIIHCSDYVWPKSGAPHAHHHLNYKGSIAQRSRTENIIFTYAVLTAAIQAMRDLGAQRQRGRETGVPGEKPSGQVEIKSRSQDSMPGSY